MNVYNETEEKLKKAISLINDARDIFAKLSIDEYEGSDRYGKATIAQFRATYNALSDNADKW